MREAKAQTRLRICAVSFEPLLLVNAINTWPIMSQLNIQCKDLHAHPRCSNTVGLEMDKESAQN